MSTWASLCWIYFAALGSLKFWNTYYKWFPTYRKGEVYIPVSKETSVHHIFNQGIDVSDKDYDNVYKRGKQKYSFGSITNKKIEFYLWKYEVTLAWKFFLKELSLFK